METQRKQKKGSWFRQMTGSSVILFFLLFFPFAIMSTELPVQTPSPSDDVKQPQTSSPEESRVPSPAVPVRRQPVSTAPTAPMVPVRRQPVSTAPVYRGPTTSYRQNPPAPVRTISPRRESSYPVTSVRSGKSQGVRQIVPQPVRTMSNRSVRQITPSAGSIEKESRAKVTQTKTTDRTGHAKATQTKTTDRTSHAKVTGQRNMTVAARTAQQLDQAARATSNRVMSVKQNVKIRKIRVGSESYCYLPDLAAFFRMRIRYYSNGVELTAPGRNFRFYNEKQFGSINYVPVSYLYPPLIRGKSQYFINEKDVRVLLSSTNGIIAASRPVQTILLDPGHGGTDKGASGTNLHEKDMNLFIALQLRSVLTALGYRVAMTRTRDITLSLKDRTFICSRVKPDLFVSIHCNASVNRAVSGIETFAPTPFNAPSTGKKVPAVSKPDPANIFDRHSYRLAFEIHNALGVQTRAVNRGVKVARYLVIRDAVCPAALVEIGFITNPTELKNFRNPSYQKKIITGIALGIHRYARILTVVK